METDPRLAGIVNRVEELLVDDEDKQEWIGVLMWITDQEMGLDVADEDIDRNVSRAVVRYLIKKSKISEKWAGITRQALTSVCK